MLPATTDSVWKRIATGAIPIRSSKLAINLLAQSNKMSYERDQSPENVKQLAAKTYKFFAQFESTFADEFTKILAL